VASAINGGAGDSEDEKYEDDNDHVDESPCNKNTSKETGKSKGSTGSGSSSWKSKATGDELFSEEEKIRIGLMKAK